MGCGASVEDKVDGDKQGGDDDGSIMKIRSRTEEHDFTNFSIDTFPSLQKPPLELTTLLSAETKTSETNILVKTSSTKKKIRSALKKKFIFGYLSYENLERLIDIFSPKTCEIGDEIIKQGTCGDFMYVVESGNFNVLKNGQIVSTDCASGFIIGELSLLYEEKRSVSLVCSEDAVIWTLDRPTFIRDFQHKNESYLSTFASKVLPIIPELKDLSKTQLVRVAEIAFIVEFEESSIVSEMNQIGTAFYIILEGNVIGSQTELIYGIGEETSQNRSISFSSLSMENSSYRRTRYSDGYKTAVGGEGGGGGDVKKDEENLHAAAEKESKNRNIHIKQKEFYQSKYKKNSIDLNNYKVYKVGDWFGEECLFRKGNETNMVADSTVRLLAFDIASFETVIGNMEDIKERYNYQDILLSLPLLSKFSADIKLEAFDMFTLETYQDLSTILRVGDINSKFIYVKEGCVILSEPISAYEPTTPPPSSWHGRRRSWNNSHAKTSSWIYEIEDDSGTRTVSASRDDGDNSDSDTNTVLPASSLSSDNDGLNDGTCDIDETAMNSMKVLNSTYEMGPGEYLGARELMEGAPNSYTMVAKGEVKCFVLTLERYTRLLSSNENANENIVEKKSHVSKIQTKKKKRKSKEEKEDLYNDAKALSSSWYGLTDLGPIGRGTFGLVHMVQDSNHKNKKTFALKIVSHEIIERKNHLNRLMSEIDILNSLKSPFISKLYGSREDSFGYYLLLELVQGGELKRLIHPKDKTMKADQIQMIKNGELAGIPHLPSKFYISGISLALTYLHKKVIIYRDLKPTNIMIDEYGYPKLIDLGLSIQLKQSDGGKAFTLCGRTEYLAPEMIVGSGYNKGVDWWALGILLYEMIVGTTPFVLLESDNQPQNQMKIFEVFMYPHFWLFLSRCLFLYRI